MRYIAKVKVRLKPRAFLPGVEATGASVAELIYPVWQGHEAPSREEAERKANGNRRGFQQTCKG